MCIFTQLIKNKKYTANKKNGGKVPIAKDMRVMAVPIGCGHCIECRQQKAKEWQVRLLEDVRHNTNGKFITLTFSNESIKKITEEVRNKKNRIKVGIRKSWVDKNGKLCHRYRYKTIKEEVKIEGYELDNAIATYGMRKFLERGRKKNKKATRHWFITELGHKGTENIHLHGIVWTKDEEEELRKQWDYGYIWIGKKQENGKYVNYVNKKTANYITKYVQKVDFDHRYFKPKILTSAGIGAGYMKRTDWIGNKYKENGETDEAYTTETGHKMTMPIYWRNKIYTEEEREQLWLEKLDKEIRYVLGEKIDVSTEEGNEEYYKALEFARRKNKELGYGSSDIDWSRKKYEEDRRNMLTNKRTGKLGVEEIDEDTGRWNHVSQEVWG